MAVAVSALVEQVVEVPVASEADAQTSLQALEHNQLEVLEETTTQLEHPVAMVLRVVLVTVAKVVIVVAPVAVAVDGTAVAVVETINLVTATTTIPVAAEVQAT